MSSEFDAGDGYDGALILFRFGGLPVLIASLDLAPGNSDVARQWPDVVDRVRGTVAQATSTPPVPIEQLPRISVVVPTIGARLADLEACLDSLGRLNYPSYEIIVVDNRRVVPLEDSLTALLAGRSRVRCVRESTPGISAARNKGVEASSAAIVAFTDDDVRVDPSWLLAIGSCFARGPDLDAVTGMIFPAELECPSQIWFERYYGGFGGVRQLKSMTAVGVPRFSAILGHHNGRVRLVDEDGVVREHSLYGIGVLGAGANMAFRKASLERVGGFDESLGTGTPARGGEDLAVLATIVWHGGKIRYEPAALVHHRHRQEYEELLTQMDGYGLGFTAMLTSLAWRDHHHLVNMAVQLPLAIVERSREAFHQLQGVSRSRTGSSQPSGDFPRALAHRELIGYFKGPLAYVRSRRVARN